MTVLHEEAGRYTISQVKDVRVRRVEIEYTGDFVSEPQTEIYECEAYEGEDGLIYWTLRYTEVGPCNGSILDEDNSRSFDQAFEEAFSRLNLYVQDMV